MEEKVFLKCPEKNCPLSFQKRFNLNRHYERFHMNSAIVQKCFLCGQIFENSEKIQEHYLTNHTVHKFKTVESAFRKAVITYRYTFKENEFKKLLIEYSKNQSFENGLKIAEGLQYVTTQKSGLGLLFLIHGSSNGKTKIVLSRFAADEGISAKEAKDKLNVEFVQNVFMKNALNVWMRKLDNMLCALIMLKICVNILLLI